MNGTSRYFSPRRAARSLVLLRRIVADVVADAPRIRRLQELLEAAELSGRTDQASAARHDLAATARRYLRYTGELQEMGVELVDPDAGVVEFPCIADGTEVRLVWQFDDSALSGWHEVGECCAACKPISSLPSAPALAVR